MPLRTRGYKGRMSKLNELSHRRRDDRIHKTRNEYIGCLEDLIQYGENDEYSSKHITKTYDRMVRFYPQLLEEFE